MTASLYLTIGGVASGVLLTMLIIGLLWTGDRRMTTEEATVITLSLIFGVPLTAFLWPIWLVIAAAVAIIAGPPRISSFIRGWYNSRVDKKLSAIAAKKMEQNKYYQ